MVDVVTLDAVQNMHSWSDMTRGQGMTHITVDHGGDVVHVVTLDGSGGEKLIGVVSGIAPLQIVDLGIS